jgi:hypothetical protein
MQLLLLLKSRHHLMKLLLLKSRHHLMKLLLLLKPQKLTVEPEKA